MAPRKPPSVGGKIQPPCYPFNSWNEVSSERGQWETSGGTCSPQSFLSLGQITSAGSAAQAPPLVRQDVRTPRPLAVVVLKRLFTYWVFSPSPFSFL